MAASRTVPDSATKGDSNSRLNVRNTITPPASECARAAEARSPERARLTARRSTEKLARARPGQRHFDEPGNCAGALPPDGEDGARRRDSVASDEIRHVALGGGELRRQ